MHNKRLLTILALVALALMTLHFPAAAQEATVEPAPTAETTVASAAEATVEPTVEVTVEPTQPPTVPEATETPVTTVEPLPEVTPEAEVTAAPTVAPVPPVFHLPDAAYEATAGIPLTVTFGVSDEAGVVRVALGEPAPAGGVSLTTVPPIETQPPFTTQVELVYLAPAEFSGMDSVKLVAIGAAGGTAEAVITVNVVAALPSPTPSPTPEPVKELLINYDPAASEAAIQAMLAALNAVEISRIPAIGAMRVLVPEAVSQPQAAVMALQASQDVYRIAGVRAIEPNVPYRLDTNDPRFSEQWALEADSGAEDGGIAVEYAWTQSTARGLGITVAVLDTGVDRQHPELSTQLLTTGWDIFNDDNNPDDSLNLEPGEVLDGMGHGTFVAGIIAAKTNNLIGIAGVAYNAKIMPVKVCDKVYDLDTGDPYVGCPAYYVAGGIVHAVDKGAKIINLSLGGPASDTVLGAVNYALSRNVVVVASAGNSYEGDTTPFYPAAFPGVIGVGAHDINGNTAPFSVSNASVDISAPGVNILSTVPIEMDVYGAADGYGILSGTSMSAPHVSGVAALLMSAKVATTPATVLDALQCGAEDAGDPGPDPDFGSGMLKADYSMNWRGNSAGCKVTQPNDNFETATLVRAVPYKVVQPVHSRSVTEQAGDPQLCGLQREQTLWYTFRPTVTNYYQLSVLGSSYSPVFGLYQGTPGALNELGCSTDPQKALPMQAYQTYYIMVATSGAAVDDQVLQLQINAALPLNNVDYQETVPNIAYTGMWARGAVYGASGGYTQQTTDTGAAASFSFRGVGFYYVRTVGPDKGAARIFVNGVELDSDSVADGTQPFSNRAAITKSNQAVAIAVPGAVPGQWNIVRIMRDPNTPGMIDLDRIRTYEYAPINTVAVITTKADDRDARLRYSPSGTGADWNKTITLPTAYAKTLTETTSDTASVAFRMSGSALTIFRMTGAGMADMEVVIDSGAPISVPNPDPSGSLVIRPYTIDGLVNMAHVVEIRRVPGSGTLQLDAVQPYVQATLLAGYTYDERHAALAYRGMWTDAYPVSGAYAGTTRTLNANAEVSFQFNGTDLCINYQRPVSGNLDVYIDGEQMATLPAEAGNGFVIWCLGANEQKLVPPGVHRARLVAPSGGFTLNYVRPQNVAILTPARGLVQETDLSLTFSAPSAWPRVNAAMPAPEVRSPYLPQGGYMKRTDIAGSTVSFYINGSGFILYTAVGTGQGCWQISVDDVLIDVDGDPDGIVDLRDDRSRPLGYGVTNLTPGIHYVQLQANTSCDPPLLAGSYFANFDAIRVFP